MQVEGDSPTKEVPAKENVIPENSKGVTKKPASTQQRLHEVSQQLNHFHSLTKQPHSPGMGTKSTSSRGAAKTSPNGAESNDDTDNSLSTNTTSSSPSPDSAQPRHAQPRQGQTHHGGTGFSEKISTVLDHLSELAEDAEVFRERCRQSECLSPMDSMLSSRERERREQDKKFATGFIGRVTSVVRGNSC
jgi:hypothetical protein